MFFQQYNTYSNLSKSLLNNEIILPEDFYGGIDGYIQGPLNKFIETYEKDYLKYNLNCSTKYEHDTKKIGFSLEMMKQ